MNISKGNVVFWGDHMKEGGKIIKIGPEGVDIKWNSGIVGRFSLSSFERPLFRGDALRIFESPDNV